MTVTGVAPWAQHAPLHQPSPLQPQQQHPLSLSPTQPLTQTSIHALSDDKEAAAVEMKESVHLADKDETGMRCMRNSSCSGFLYLCSNIIIVVILCHVDLTTTGLARLLRYISLCQPATASDADEDDTLTAETRSWNRLLQAPSPTLLPSLRFHDLVFGRELGRGAFSVVKYARHVHREKSSVAWPEYAVKVITHFLPPSLTHSYRS